MQLNTSAHDHTILSVPGKMQCRHKWPASTIERSVGLWSTQTWRSERRKTGNPRERMIVELRFDDNCRNGHHTFSITCEIYEGTRDVGGGANHDLIGRVFPELLPLIKWHLCSTDGPLHYLKNTVYLAGEKDCFGRKMGEASRWDHIALVGTSPIPHKLPPKFWQWIQQGHNRFGPMVPISHPREPGTFSAKYTLSEYTDKWHECPFDTVEEAHAWREAITKGLVKLKKQAAAYSDGKEPELDSARSSAIWPEATDDDLREDGLEQRLIDRLPALIAEFTGKMSAIGFAEANQ